MTKTYTTDAYIARETAKAVRLDLGDLFGFFAYSKAEVRGSVAEVLQRRKAAGL